MTSGKENDFKNLLQGLQIGHRETFGDRDRSFTDFAGVGVQRPSF